MLASINLFFVLSSCLGHFSLVGGKESSANALTVEVRGLEILELDELDPVDPKDIGINIPTAELSVDAVEQLNLYTWARSVIRAVVVSVGAASADPSEDLDHVIAAIESAVDPDFSAHACSMKDAGKCNITYPKTQDKNRYLDMVVHYKSSLGSGRLRVLVLEDAAKAVNTSQPFSFDVNILQLQVNGAPSTSGFVSKHLSPSSAGTKLDGEGLDWVNSALIDTMVSTVTSWTWHCSPRYDSGDFEATFKQAIVSFEANVSGKWIVDCPASSSHVQNLNGVYVELSYALCGHLMLIPIRIQSAPSVAALPLVV